jgi:putative oxidoreductase
MLPMAVRILGWLLAALFVLSGVTKLVGQQQALEAFAHMGYSDWFRLLIGALETAGGIGLAIPSTAKAAAIGLLVIMAGAVYSVFQIGESLVPPVVVGALLIARIALDRRSLRAAG